MTTLIASSKERAARSAARLGFVWGLGHGTSLFVFGLPIVLYRAYLPESLQRDAETAVGLMIVVLAMMLLNRWRLGRFHVQVHEHDGERHSHGARTPIQAYVIGLVHGIGGSAGVGVLLLASIPSRPLAIVSLGVFAFFTAVSMSLLSSGFGLTLSRPRARRSFARVAPASACEPGVRRLVRPRRTVTRALRVLTRYQYGVTKQIAPYGAWASPITIDDAASSGDPFFGYTIVDFDDGGLLWLEPRPAQAGRSALVRNGAEFVPADFDARTRVHEYGGGAVWTGGGAIFASSFADGRVYRVEDGTPRPVTPVLRNRTRSATRTDASPTRE